MSVYKLSNLIRARFPLIYVTTFEEDRVTKYIKSVVTSEKLVKFPREVFSWTQTSGLYNDTTQKNIPDTDSPCKMLEFIRKYDKDSEMDAWNQQHRNNQHCRCRKKDSKFSF